MKRICKLIILLGFAVTGYRLSVTDHCLHAASAPLFRATAQRTGALVEQAEPVLVPQWNYQIREAFVSSPVTYRGIVYCGARDGSLWAWDAYSGTPLWDFPTSGWVDATPCVSSSTVYVASRDGHVYAVDRITGEQLWATPTGAENCSSPIVNDDKLYLVSGYPEKKVFVIDANDGTKLADYAISQFGFSSPAIKNNLLYFGTNDGKFHCIDLTGGQEKWSKPTQGGVFFARSWPSRNYREDTVRLDLRSAWATTYLPRGRKLCFALSYLSGSS